MSKMKVLVVVSNYLRAPDARKVFPDATVAYPGTGLVGHRFDQIVMLWRPDNDRDLEWFNEQVSIKGKQGVEPVWLV